MANGQRAAFNITLEMVTKAMFADQRAIEDLNLRRPYLPND